MNDHLKIRCVIEGFSRLAEAEAEERAAREAYEGYSWGYHGQSYFKRIDEAAEELEQHLNAYIDERIEKILKART